MSQKNAIRQKKRIKAKEEFDERLLLKRIGGRILIADKILFVRVRRDERGNVRRLIGENHVETTQTADEQSRDEDE